MKKIFEKNIQGITIVISINDNKELKIGSLDDFNNGHMKAFVLSDNMWYGVGLDLLHTGANISSGLNCNIGANLLEDNSEFPYEFITEDEAFIINDMIGRI